MSGRGGKKGVPRGRGFHALLATDGDVEAEALNEGWRARGMLAVYLRKDRYSLVVRELTRPELDAVGAAALAVRPVVSPKGKGEGA